MSAETRTKYWKIDRKSVKNPIIGLSIIDFYSKTIFGNSIKIDFEILEELGSLYKADAMKVYWFALIFLFFLLFPG